jgi:hypothetical protein
MQRWLPTAVGPELLGWSPQKTSEKGDASMRAKLIPLVCVFCALVLTAGPAGAGITVPGTADPNLAGMPDDSSAPNYDVAPGQSPVQVTSVPIVPGTALVFSATGLATVQYGLNYYSTPNGYNYPVGPFPGLFGTDVNPANGISDPANVPAGSLVGVFLDDNQPNLSPAPPSLDFQLVPGGVFYTTLTPGLKQVFYIGDGHNAGSAFSGIQQEIIVPAGATRLYLGYGDYGATFNNGGSFDVDVSTVPEPATLIIWSLLGGLGIALGVWRRRKDA